MLKRFLSLIFLVFPLFAFAEEFIAGKDYELINSASMMTKSNKVSVREFFSYGCPWCSRIEPALMNWVKQQNGAIEFSRVPVVFNKDWSFYAKAYYTAQLLNLDDKLNPLLFQAIQGKKGAMTTNEEMINFFISHGVDNVTAKSAFENSTIIDAHLNEGATLMSRYHVTGVPAVVVNNQYKTDLQMAKGEERFLKILDYLIAKSK